MKTGKVLLGLISGAAAGLAFGILYAPKKGKDTRDKITKKSDDYLKGAKGKLDDFSDSVSHKIDALKAKGKAQTSDNKAEEKLNEAKAKLHDMKA